MNVKSHLSFDGLTLLTVEEEITKRYQKTPFLKLNLAFWSDSFWDWANEIWSVRSIQRSQNLWFLGILSCDSEIQKFFAGAYTLQLKLIILLTNDSTFSLTLMW